VASTLNVPNVTVTSPRTFRRAGQHRNIVR
jgi:hypothetical protein